MTANDSKLYLSYLNELVDQYNNTFHYSINEKLLMLLILLWLEKLRWILSLLNLMIRVRITKCKNIFIEDYAENWSREIFIVDSVFKTNPLTYKIKDLNREKIIRSFMKNNCCWFYYIWVIIQNQIVILVIKSKQY